MSPVRNPAPLARTKTKPKAGPKRGAKALAEPRLSHQHQPEAMAADDWQRVLRRQFGSEQPFDLQRQDGLDLAATKRLPVFSD